MLTVSQCSISSVHLSPSGRDNSTPGILLSSFNNLLTSWKSLMLSGLCLFFQTALWLNDCWHSLERWVVTCTLGWTIKRPFEDIAINGLCLQILQWLFIMQVNCSKYWILLCSKYHSTIFLAFNVFYSPAAVVKQ